MSGLVIQQRLDDRVFGLAAAFIYLFLFRSSSSYSLSFSMMIIRQIASIVDHVPASN